MIDPDVFAKRPVREEACCQCEGSGKISAPYILVSASLPIVGAPEEALCAATTGAATIIECVREAKDLAQKAKCPVAFQYMSQVVIVKDDDAPLEIARDWWHKNYGESAEMSWKWRSS